MHVIKIKVTEENTKERVKHDAKLFLVDVPKCIRNSRRNQNQSKIEQEQEQNRTKPHTRSLNG